MNDAMITKALWAYLEGGLSIVPINPKTKRPFAKLLPQALDDEGHPLFYLKADDESLSVTTDDTGFPKGTWAPFQERQPTMEEAQRWLDNGIVSMAVVAGRVSGGVEILDFDIDGYYERWTALVGDLANNLPVQRTGGGGIQVAWRCDEPEPNQKLAWHPDPAAHTGRVVAIETRGEGGYAVLPPSLHPSGNHYQLLRGRFSDIPHINQPVRNFLMSCARQLCQAPKTKQDLEREALQEAEKEERRRNYDGESVIDAYNAKHGIEAVLTHYGYTKAHGGRWSRPGDKDSAGVEVIKGQNKTYHYSSNDPLDSDSAGEHQPRAPFDYFLHFDHRGDYKAAVKAAALEMGMAKPARTYTNGHAPYTNEHSKPVTSGEPTSEPATFVEISEAEKEHLTDLGNGKRIARLHGQDLRYTQAFGWATWDGARWKRDETGQVMRIAKQTALGFYAESARIMEKAKAAVKAAEAAATNNDADSAGKHSEKARELMKLAYALSDWAKKCQGRARLEAMIALAQSELPIATHSDDFDKNDWLLNVNNGTIDLRTGRLQPHRREDYITKIAPVHFDPHATCPTWIAFLKRIMDGNQDVIDFLQRAIGYSLTGATVDHALFFAYGGGQNGKSTFFETLAALLGEYWQKAPTEILMVKDRTTGIPNDIARLVGLRMVVAAEVEEGSRMAEKQVKDLTGGDTLVARFLNKEFFEFKPTHKVWMYGNHKPVIRGTDTGIWRRVKLIPFMVTIPENERDPDLKNKLFQELHGILAWAVQGCLDWQKNGLKPPTVVQLATEQYKTESDTFSAFLSECTIKKEDARTQAGKLYLAYQTWCKENGEKPLGGNRFGGQLVEHGFKKHQAMGRFYYNGIGLLLDE